MNRGHVEGNWKHLTGRVRKQWSKLTDEEPQDVSNRRDPLNRKLYERLSKDDMEKQLSEWRLDYAGADEAKTMDNRNK